MPEWLNVLVLLFGAVGGIGGVVAYLNYRRMARRDEFDILRGMVETLTKRVETLEEWNRGLRLENRRLRERVAALEAILREHGIPANNDDARAT